MTTDETAIQDLVKKITEETLRQLELQGTLTKGVLAVFADYVFDQSGVDKYLREKQAAVTSALFENASFSADFCQPLQIATPASKKQLVFELMHFTEVVLVTPPLSLIRTLASGDDREFAALLAIRPLLWGKPVTLLLDFEVPRFQRSTFFEQFTSDLHALESMGFRLSCLKRQPASGEAELKDLVTEQDVKDAYANGQASIRIKPDAIVTQLAAESASALGVRIEV